MSSIKDFKNSRENTNLKAENLSQNDPKNYEKLLEENEEQAQNILDNLNRYKNLSSGELMNELYKEADKLKQKGGLDAKNLDLIKSTLSPMLNSEQKEFLDNIISSLSKN